MGFITTKLTTILGEYVYTFSKHRGQANPRQNDGLSLSSHKGETVLKRCGGLPPGFWWILTNNCCGSMIKSFNFVTPQQWRWMVQMLFLQTFWVLLRWTRRYMFRGVYVFFFWGVNLTCWWSYLKIFTLAIPGLAKYTYTFYTDKNGETNLTYPTSIPM